jgi:hypothetical protein
MWASHCSYINKLLPPSEFEEKMNTFIVKALIYKIFTRFRFAILHPRLDWLGLGAHGMDHWVGSHPSLIPCDFNFEQSQEVSIGPSRKGSFVKEYQPDKQNDLEGYKRGRMREFYFLAGYLLKWYVLYQELPAKDHWAWTWFPDSEKWKEGISIHGPDRVVKAITEEFALTETEAAYQGHET